METLEQKNKTVLITGGAGFIGSHLCAKYLAEGWGVICVDNLQKTRSTVNIDKFKDNKNFIFHEHDIVDPFQIEQSVDLVLNFACPVSCVDLQVDPIHTIKTNVGGVINVLEIARKHKAVFVQASSSDIYGEKKSEAQKESEFGSVNTLTPRACYEEGKRMAETICMDYYRQYGVDVKILRIFNTYGPNLHYRDGRVVSNFIVAALANRDLTIYGDGSFTRCHLYIDDLVDAIDKLSKKEFGFTGPVNIGSEKEITVKELAEMILKLTGSKSKIIYDRELAGDPRFRRPDISLARKELNWEPKVGLEAGLVKTIEYYRHYEMPDKKILVFATTYYPDIGPAERAMMELSNQMPDTEFHIITTKSRKNLPNFEEMGNSFIYRVGGGTLGKYLFPWRGARKARELMKKNNFRFVWAIMASYAGLAAARLKKTKKDLNFLLTFDKSEDKKRGRIKSQVVQWIYKWISKKADTMFVFGDSSEQAKKFSACPYMTIINSADESFLKKVSDNYCRLLDKQEKKLARPL